jgi:glyoxylase I family protein
MAKIKHIAIATQNEEATAKFYMDAFGLSQVGKIDIPAVSGYFLTDGDINLAILHFKDDKVAGVERGKEWTGIHHIGFQVESLEEIIAKIAAAGGSPREDINQALNFLAGPAGQGNAEMRFSGPEGVTFDVSHIGWAGTSGKAQGSDKKRSPRDS